MANTCDPGPIFSLLPSQNPCTDQRYFDPLKPTLSSQPNWLSPLSTYLTPWNGPIVPPAPTVPSANPDISQLFANTKLQPQSGISEEQFKTIADQLKVEVAVIKAFAKVETGGAPFDHLGRPAILYERQWFHTLTKGKYDTTHPHISDPNAYHPNPKKKPRPKHLKKGASAPSAPFNPVQADPKDDYYGNDSTQYPRLKEAYDLDSGAALESASWGRFQVLGVNHKRSGFPTVQAFVLAMMRSEYSHLEAFAGFVLRTKGLQAACQKKDWARMAHLYNGPKYQKYHYDTKLKKAYDDLTK